MPAHFSDSVFRLGEPVLKNITVSIDCGEKIGVCGRTGRYVVMNAALRRFLTLRTVARRP